ncbi:hypothetical protein NEOLEDRAFT_1143501 [Neolentinus lepideus HHB14362 ss-1]|uniref:Uncharacterized protein n=1 Tax=Neolentinus lepideus HHB14362 ss-1 TaxID=1314782 RepID=A0A165MHU6_9AGAM|nr:hypothetical protein NEOLEDRAFT_1143501 [Neolentinus lepideus HHB14362 ss-1]
MASTYKYFAHSPALLDSLSSYAQNLLLRSTKNPLQSFAKSAILSTLARITRGQLRLESLGVLHEFGSGYTLPAHIGGPSAGLAAKITVVDEGFWVRLLLHADFGFAGEILAAYFSGY